MRFSRLSNDEELRAYLREFTLRNDEERNTLFLSHYSSISKVLNILKSGYLWLGDYRQMNDPFETQLMNKYNLARNYFFISFSMAEESLAMYKMYGGYHPDSTVILQLSLTILEDIMSVSYHGESINGVDDDGEFDEHFRKLSIVKNGVVTKRLKGASVYATEVAYVDPISSTVSAGKHDNNKIISPLGSKKLAGIIKYKCWDYENEVRLCAYSSQTLDNDEILAIKLPKNICRHVKLVLGPGFDVNKYKDELFELRLLGVVWQNSIYEGYYTELTRGYSGAYSLSQKLYIKDYLNKAFSGIDPWGEDIFFRITGFTDNKVSWTWKNIVMANKKRITIEIDGISYLSDELTFGFEFAEKKPISDDPNEYLYYAYQGGILLSGDKVFYHLMVEIVLFMVFTDRVQITMRILVRGEMQII